VNQLELWNRRNQTEPEECLIPYECRVMVAHVRMLGAIGLVTRVEEAALVAVLQECILRHGRGEQSGTFQQCDSQERVDQYLTQRLGVLGRRVRTARADQEHIWTVLRLYEKEQLCSVRTLLLQWLEGLRDVQWRHGDVEFPGYTHLRPAMPTTFGYWIQGYLDTAEDTVDLLNQALELADRCPMGTGAGFGLPEIDVQPLRTAERLGFARLDENGVAVQLSGGKIEVHLLHVLSLILLDLNRMASDLLLFSSEGFGFFQLAASQLSRSSLMPHKRNPEVLEHIRVMVHSALGEEVQLKSLLSNLSSGYQADLKSVRRPMVRAVQRTQVGLMMICRVLNGLVVHEETCRSAARRLSRSAEAVYQLVHEGYTLDEAYAQIAATFEKE